MRLEGIGQVMASKGLIADIGGTNARFALADENGFTQEKVLQCADYDGIADAAKAYLDGIEGDRPTRAAFAIAGPVNGDWFEMTNHVWKFSVEETRLALGLDFLELLNDFKAVALGIPHLDSKYIVQVGGAQKPVPHGTIGVLGPGTGLGVAGLIWAGDRYIANAGEGPHVTMPAKTQREFDIFRTLKYKYRHVSAERVCSGKGLVNIYNAIRILDGHEEMADKTPEEITSAAINGSCAVSEEALDKMMGFLGTIAGNLALTLGAHGGIYIAGGIPAKLGEYFFNSRFREEFDAKGRFEDYQKSIPTYLITHPFIAFVGLQAYLMES